ncbi:MAG: bifunctional aldolase/short-chain dehydrogenase, partial [Planctomycetota bacterium]
MKSLWNDKEAAEFVDRYSEHGEDLALRVYTSRLIGRDYDLVMHGGGNTSVKTELKDLFGEPYEAICVKGSGWDLVDIEPAGLPGLEMAGLRKLRALDALSDEEMVNQLRLHLGDAKAPNPSVETLLHAFLEAKFVDHSHADAVLILGNQPDGEKRMRDALGDKVAILPWIMPGFPLAKAVADACEAQPGCEGVMLLQHGIFSFAEDARTSYEFMVQFVDRAESAIQAATKKVVPMLSDPADTKVQEAEENAAKVLPIIRGALARNDGQERVIADWRCADDLLAFAEHADAPSLLATGPITPDHVIRTKGPYLHLSLSEAQDRSAVDKKLEQYRTEYKAYFDGCVAAKGGEFIMLDPDPRVIMVEGVGLLSFGANKKAASVAGDLAEHTVRAKAQAAAIGEYVDLSLEDLFEMEYWSLEQAKLGKKKSAALAGKIALITGAGGAIGHGIAEVLLESGAQVMLTDRSEEQLQKAGELLGQSFPERDFGMVVLDVTDANSVTDAFAATTRRYGGVDILVPNAGIAHVSELAEMDLDQFRKVVDVNLTGTLTVLREAAKIFLQQRTGGSVIVQASKNVFQPGASFGAYSASKAGAHQLGKVAALELAPL